MNLLFTCHFPFSFHFKTEIRKHDLFLIADEVYREFTYDNLEHYSIMQEEGIESNAIIIDSVSKRYSMCGARIGCILTRNKSIINTVLN